MLVADPCTLLDPVRPGDEQRFRELAKDHDGAGGDSSDKSECEARVSLTLEYRGLLDGPLERPRWGEALDRHEVAWDFKAEHSEAAIRARAAERAAAAGKPPPAHVNTAAAYDRNVALQRIYEKQQGEFGVVVDLRRLELVQAEELVDAIYADARLDLDRLVIFPDLTPFQQQRATGAAGAPTGGAAGP